MPQVAAQYFLDQRCEFVVGDRVEDLSSDRLVFAESTTEEDVITVQRLARALGLGTEQANVTHVVLGAGIRATGEVNVHRAIELHTLVEIVSERERVAFRIGLRELA